VAEADFGRGSSMVVTEMSERDRVSAWVLYLSMSCRFATISTSACTLTLQQTVSLAQLFHILYILLD